MDFWVVTGLTHKLNFYIFLLLQIPLRPPGIRSVPLPRLWQAQQVPQGRRTHRCLVEEHGAPGLLMQSRQLLDRDAARQSMAAVAGGCLIKLYELTNLSSCKGETSHQCSPKRLPLRQYLPREDSPKRVHVQLDPNESLADDDKASDV